ncbi:Rapamycin-insensitive companion of mTOR, N-term-domain-containing protein [Geranomyces variabilis]|nr:Rapamycin-insensitive companion of mTOR, N-term-domain-containing protein [Geranomyces variabilis]KAJ3132320.1 hypothetical protein HDU90_007381 [Geranomyces variabilis]
MDQLSAEEIDRLRAEKPVMMAKIVDQLVIEFKLKTGAETMLQVSESGEKGGTISREQVEAQLTTTKNKIAALQQQLDLYKSIPETSARDRMTQRPSDDLESLRLRQNRGLGDDSRQNRASTTSLETKSTLDLLKEMAQQLLQRISNCNDHPTSRSDALTTLTKLVTCVSDIRDYASAEQIVRSLRSCLVYQSKDLRTHAFRVLRLVATDIEWLEAFVDAHIDIFVMRQGLAIALTRDQRYEAEREQALKLIRQFIDIPGGAEVLPQNLARITVAVAEQVDDRLRSICLETLCELAIRNMPLLTFAGGTGIIFGALLDGPRELIESLVRTVLFMLDSQETRSYLRPAVELEMIMSHFTDAYSRGPANEEKLTACARAVTLLFKSWTGLIYLCLDNKRAIRSIVESLRLPYDENRKILLEMLFEIFQIDVPKWYPDFLSARSRFGNQYPLHEDLLPQVSEFTSIGCDGKNLVDHYLSIVLVILIDVGLLEVLVELLSHENKYITTRVTILVGEMIELCNRLLPVAYGTRIQSLPTLFKIASDFHDELRRHQGTLALTYIDGLHKSKERMQALSGGAGSASSRRWTKSHNRLGRSRQVESVKIRMGIQIDDVHFKIMLADLEKVLGSKEYTKWNWDTIIELIQGPLLNPKRFDEAIKSTKVVKRIISFFRPLNYQFSNVKRNKNSAKYIRTGCELMKTLLATSDGIRYLSDNKLLGEIAECFAQLDPAATQTNEIVFSKERMETTLTGEYFTFLGILTANPEGTRLLEKFRMFSLFYRLTELRSRDDLVKAMILCMDYSRDNHPRVLLSKVMTSGYKHVRLASTDHLRTLLEMGVSEFHEWGIQLLVTQLYDPSIEVCERAVRVLDRACNDRRNLESVVNMRPSLDHLGEAGNPLLLRFLSTSVGFDYLDQLNYVEREMDYWFEQGNDHYVIGLELSLARALSPQSANPLVELARDLNGPTTDEVDLSRDQNGVAPPHFYGELARTQEGTELLRSKGHFSDFTSLIRRRRQNGWAGVQPADVLHLKGVLWAVGNIGAVPTGLPFLLEEDLIQDIVELARSCPYITLKGTCYYVLGLISKTAQGVEILDDLGWETVLPPGSSAGAGKLEGLCIPKDSASFLKMPLWTYKGSWPEYTVEPLSVPSPVTPCPRNTAAWDHGDNDDDETASTDSDVAAMAADREEAEADILKCISNMSNHILANAASKALSKFRTEAPHLFTSAPLYLVVLHMLAVYHFRLTARRFIHELFDKVIWDSDAITALDALPPMTVLEPDIAALYYQQETERRKREDDDEDDDVVERGIARKKREEECNGGASGEERQGYDNLPLRVATTTMAAAAAAGEIRTHAHAPFELKPRVVVSGFHAA